MEKQTDQTFHGQQEGEKLLSTITPHPSTVTLEYFKLLLISLFLFIGFSSLREISPWFVFTGIILSIAIFIIGFFVNRAMHSQRVTYITDRRIVRFESSNALVANSRSLTWDNVIKVKTFSRSFFWRLKNIGTVIVHSRTTSEHIIDDIIIKDVHYYRDLGNYIDRILYLHGNDQKELSNIHPFVAKPKGKRY